MVEDMGLKITASRSLEWHYLYTKFHKNLPSSSKVISRAHRNRQMDKQTGDLISLLSFLESRLKTMNS
jgi:hypothetical protein